jgi:hypothetical protein
MSKQELLDHNISTFLRRTDEMPNGIILHPKAVEILVNEYKEAFGNINIMNVNVNPIKYRGIPIYECLGLNENEIKLTYEL